MSFKKSPKLSVPFFLSFFFSPFLAVLVFAAAVLGLLTVVAFLDAEHGLQGAGF